MKMTGYRGTVSYLTKPSVTQSLYGRQVLEQHSHLPQSRGADSSS